MKKGSNNEKSFIEFTIKELESSLSDNGDIIVPTYQRGISWRKNQQDNLIDSLMNGYPFGCLLLYKIDNKKYKIIDGLQRSYTVIDFYKNPLKYFSERYFPEKEILAIAKNSKEEETREDIIVNLPEMIKEYVLHNCSDIPSMQSIDLTSLMIEIIEKWRGLLLYTEDIKNRIHNIIEAYCNSYEAICTNLKVPALIFEAPEEKLPEIFERINSEGAKLTKYQIYAATWSDDKVIIDNKKLSEIITNVKSRYDSYLQEVGVLEGYDSVKLTRTKQINIFDMIYGFGKMICKKYKNLFLYEENVAKVESIGFNLINSCLLQKSSNMKNLNLSIEKCVGYSSKDISAFLLAIIDCIEYVSKKLSRGIEFKGNKNMNYNSSPIHTELQITSIIASLFIAKYMDYSVDTEGNITNIKFNKVCNPNWSRKHKSLFDNNILRIYSLDLIGSKWRGSGDTKLYNIITNRTYYMRKVEWDEFSTCLDIYFNNQKNERNERVKVANPNGADKLILNIIYSSILSAKDQIDDSGYDIEHLATKGIMKSRIKNFNDIEFSLPISSIANLCLLPKEYNEQKGEKLMYQFKEYYDPRTKKMIQIPILKYEKKFTFTKEADFDWIIDENIISDSALFKESYENSLFNRFKKMKTKIKNSMFQNE